jgi:ribosomal-protein-alanine N-acetyltransferase
MSTDRIETQRLILRPWKESDRAPFAALNADPAVMEFFPAPLTAAETDAMIAIIHEKFEKNGYGFWAAELKGTGEFIGFIGLNVPGYPLPFQPCVEIGWRLAKRFWGQGFAQEGARASLDYGFGKLGLQEIVSFTTWNNRRSQRVMEAIGMLRDSKGDFDHPKIDVGNPLCRHVLYRLQRS